MTVTYLTVNGIVLVFVEPCFSMKPRLLGKSKLGPIGKQEAVSPLRAGYRLHICLRALPLLLRWHHDCLVVKRQERYEAAVSRVDHCTEAYAGPLSDILGCRRIPIVSETSEKDGELSGDRKLGGVGVVVEDLVALDESHKVVENVW